MAWGCGKADTYLQPLWRLAPATSHPTPLFQVCMVRHATAPNHTNPYQQATQIGYTDTIMPYAACGLCQIKDQCTPCRLARGRMSRYVRVGKFEYMDAVLVSEAEACELLMCSQRELNTYIKRKQVRVAIESKAARHIVFEDVAARLKDILTAAFPRQEVYDALPNIMGNLINGCIELQKVFADRLQEFGLTETDTMFPHGKLVDLTTPPPTGWYVYHLCYATGRPFYVGKGRGRRMYQHEVEARRGGKGYKCNVIRKVLARGESIVYRVVFLSPSEEEAYAFERIEIARYGRDRLTNIDAGGRLSVETERRMGFDGEWYKLNYAQFVALLPVLTGGYKPLTKEQRQEYIKTWASARSWELGRLRQEAFEHWHEEGVALIDREITALEVFRLRQRELIFDRRRSAFEFIDDD